MKYSLTIIALGLSLCTLKAQQVNYKVLTDDPKDITNFSCNIDLLHMDGGFNNLDGFSFNVGVWGHAMYKHRLGVDYTCRYGWLTFGKLASNLAKNHLNIQAGGFFIIGQRNKSVSTKVVLKSENVGSTSNGGTLTRTTFINVPSTAWKYKAVRGGFYLNRSPFSIEDPNGADFYDNYYAAGVYAGICFGRTLRLSVQTDKFGVKGFAMHSRFSLDALILPVNNVPSGVKAKSPIGGRLLWQVIPSITRKEGRKGYNTSYNKRLAAEVEVGYRMVDGPYVACTVAIPIARKIKGLGVVESTNNQRTTE